MRFPVSLCGRSDTPKYGAAVQDADPPASDDAVEELLAHGSSERSGFGTLSLRRLRILPLARHGRKGLRRPAVRAGAPRPAPVPRRPCRKPACAGAVVAAIRIGQSGGDRRMPPDSPMAFPPASCSSPHLLARLLGLSRLTNVVDIGANPIVSLRRNCQIAAIARKQTDARPHKSGSVSSKAVSLH
jgi:hypothetical protein